MKTRKKFERTDVREFYRHGTHHVDQIENRDTWSELNDPEVGNDVPIPDEIRYKYY